MNNDWLQTGETENGLLIYIRRIDIDGEKYLQTKYETKDGFKTGEDTINIKKLRLLNTLADIVE